MCLSFGYFCYGNYLLFYFNLQEKDQSDSGASDGDSDSDDSDGDSVSDDEIEGSGSDGGAGDEVTPAVRAIFAQKQPKPMSVRYAEDHEQIALAQTLARGQEILATARAAGSQSKKQPRFPAHMPSYALANQHAQRQATTTVNTSNSSTTPVNPLFQRRLRAESSESPPPPKRASAKKKNVA